MRNGSNVSTNGNEKCELFNDYFVGVFGKSEMKLDSTSEPGTLNQLKVNQNQISDIMEHLNVNKSMGHDKIGNLVLKKCHSTLSKSLTLIFQTCLNKGSFPETWKLSQVTPIFKEGNKADVSCYRPISLLCCCSKILEKVIFDGIYKRTRDRLHESQFSFRERRSATIQLLVFLDRLYEFYDKVETDQLAVLYLDSVKAFDTVPHDILIQKIENYGIGGKLLSIIKSYLTDRKQYVRIEDSRSTPKAVTSGVPQGSILGPLFFLLFINDLPELLNEVDSFCYADDFKVITRKQTQLDDSTVKIENWLNANKMMPNIKKSTILNLLGEQSATLMKKSLPNVQIQRDLGVMISNNLSWNENSNRRATKAMGAFFQIKRSLSQKCAIITKLNAYTGYVVPILTFASQTWLPNKTNFATVEKVQKLATRWILGPEKSYCERMKELKLLPLSLYMEMHDILMLLAMLNDNYDVVPNETLPHAYDSTRQFQRGELPIAQTRLQKTVDNFFTRTKRLYNYLIYACPSFYQKPDKTTLTDIYHTFFQKKYNETNTCTWRLLCRCGNCNIFEKLRPN